MVLHETDRYFCTTCIIITESNIVSHLPIFLQDPTADLMDQGPSQHSSIRMASELSGLQIKEEDEGIILELTCNVVKSFVFWADHSCEFLIYCVSFIYQRVR